MCKKSYSSICNSRHPNFISFQTLIVDNAEAALRRVLDTLQPICIGTSVNSLFCTKLSTDAVYKLSHNYPLPKE